MSTAASTTGDANDQGGTYALQGRVDRAGDDMTVRMDLQEIVKALGEAAVRKLGGSGNYNVVLKSIEMERDSKGTAEKVWATLELNPK